MSPRAACRLATLGFTQVNDYVAGKVDWLARNLPVQGTVADTPTIGQRLRHDVVTARPDEPIAVLRAQVASSGARDPVQLWRQALLDGDLLHDDRPACHGGHIGARDLQERLTL